MNIETDKFTQPSQSQVQSLLAHVKETRHTHQIAM